MQKDQHRRGPQWCTTVHFNTLYLCGNLSSLLSHIRKRSAAHDLFNWELVPSRNRSASFGSQPAHRLVCRLTDKRHFELYTPAAHSNLLGCNARAWERLTSLAYGVTRKRASYQYNWGAVPTFDSVM